MNKKSKQLAINQVYEAMIWFSFSRKTQEKGQAGADAEVHVQMDQDNQNLLL